MVMLSYVSSLLKLLQAKIVWFADVAEWQVLKIADKLPEGRQGLIEWPLDVAAR